jgi:hypothetical protein
MNWLKTYYRWILLLLVTFSINHIYLITGSKPDEDVFYEYITALKGESEYTIVYNYSKPDTLFGYYPYSPEYQPLKRTLDSLDAIVVESIKKRDEVVNARYISSRNKQESTYLKIQALNDTIKANLAKGDAIRDRLNNNKDEYEKEIKGYVFNFSTNLVKDGDSLIVFDFPVWVKSGFPVNSL